LIILTVYTKRLTTYFFHSAIPLKKCLFLLLIFFNIIIIANSNRVLIECEMPIACDDLQVELEIRRQFCFRFQFFLQLFSFLYLSFLCMYTLIMPAEVKLYVRIYLCLFRTSYNYISAVCLAPIHQKPVIFIEYLQISVSQ